jgi:hypothetical protein
MCLYAQLMAFILLRHALTLSDEDDNTSAMFSVSETTDLLGIYC